MEKVRLREVKEREEENEDISLECQHFGISNENTDLVICDMPNQRG